MKEKTFSRYQADALLNARVNAQLRKAYLNIAEGALALTKQFPDLLAGRCSAEDLEIIIRCFKGKRGDQKEIDEVLKRVQPVISDNGLQTLVKLYRAGDKLFNDYDAYENEFKKTCDENGHPLATATYTKVFGTQYFGLDLGYSREERKKIATTFKDVAELIDIENEFKRHTRTIKGEGGAKLTVIPKKYSEPLMNRLDKVIARMD
jgi:hypothetical protein